jgi:hypothetical protein
MSVADSIGAAHEFLHSIGPRGDRADARPKRTQRAENHGAAQSGTVASVLDEFVRRHVNAKGLRSGHVIEKRLERVKSSIGHIGIREIRRRDVIAMLDEIADGPGLVAADRTLAYVRKAFNWYSLRDDEFVNPVVPGMARTKPEERKRTRILDDAELRDLHHALALIGEPHRSWVWLLLLCAARRNEIANAHSREFDGANLIVPAARYKSKNDHLLPLPPAALALMPRGDGFLFSPNGGGKPINGHGHIKKRIDATIAEIRQRDGREAMSRWRYHDLRRTARSLMSRAGVSTDVAERVLGHRIPGIRSTYDLHDYAAEKRCALEKLAQIVADIVK